MESKPSSQILLVVVAVLVVGGGAALFLLRGSPGAPPASEQDPPPLVLNYQPRKGVDFSGFDALQSLRPRWGDTATLDEVSRASDKLGYGLAQMLDRDAANNRLTPELSMDWLLLKSLAMNFEGKPREAYRILQEARAKAQADPSLAQQWLFTFIFAQGVAALRIGEDENCIMCRGESSCIIPISPAAVHTNPYGSRLAVTHFTEYLEQFPDDLGARWLLNVAHMTLGEYPDRIDSRWRLDLSGFFQSEFDIGKFRDIGALAGVNRLNQAGGAIMDDFDNDGLLDIVTTTMDPTKSMAFFRNKGNGTFEERTGPADLSGQLGGLNCVQTDYNNDGNLDIFICRGAWLQMPLRPSLLRNNGNGTFTDVTEEAGLSKPVNSISACWADYDNDDHLDLFVCCERQFCCLYRNKGDGTFEEVAAKAGVAGDPKNHCKGATWIDFDNDGFPDLFVTNLNGTAQLYRNNRNGTFTDVTTSMGIDGPRKGFSCWAFDFDNDGWLDIFATSYAQTLDDVVRGMQGKPHTLPTSKLYRNLGGKGFKDVTKEVGLDMVFATMGSNFGDFDNDGYLDFYLGTGDPNFSTLIPNRMFKNVGGKRFAEITASSGTGHLQKGHGVACGDWDNNGSIDIFIEMGGATNGDLYHNILYQNSGQKNNWLTVKLIGKQTNRAAIGARIKVLTSGEQPMTVHRHISSGSSFGANPLRQTIGLGKATRIDLLEIYWPTSRTTQRFRDLGVDQAIEITEQASDYRKLNLTPIVAPK
jgi:hypothetical protein